MSPDDHVHRPLSLWPPRGRRDLALNVVEKTWLRLPPPSTITREQQEQRSRDHREHSSSNSKDDLRELSWLSSSSTFRRLEGSNDNDVSYLVDQDGNELEPYSLAWRYLGMYMDCDPDEEQEEEQEEDEEEEGQDRRRRYLNSGDGDGDCERVLLWAAYRNPKYKGNSIGEYKFFDIDTFKWDTSACQKRRGCTKLDCHERKTKWELVGVFKESDGLEDWAEQLFKHQAYCLWDEDTYENMQIWREEWPNECEYLEYLLDSQGNPIYSHLKPDYGGTLSMGLYIDEKCSIESVNTYFDYVNAYYVYYVSEDEASEAVQKWIDAINGWNDAMDLFKICQPCRAYNLNPSEQEQQEGNSGDQRRRFLEDENDGEGDEEPFGYNCYDDAGYTNCNQCYKFETKTDMEAASADDLTRATAQGSVLRVDVDGATYGHGGFRSRKADFGKLLEEYQSAIVAVSLIVATASIAMIMFLSSWRKSYRGHRNKNPMLKEKFLDSDDSEAEGDSTQSEIEIVKQKQSQKRSRPLCRGRSRTRRDKGSSDLESSSFSDISTGADPGGEDVDKFVHNVNHPLKRFFSVWKNGIKGALYYGGASASNDYSSEEDDDDDESEDSQSHDSRSTIADNEFAMDKANATSENGGNTTEAGYIPPQTVAYASQFLFGDTETDPFPKPGGETTQKDLHDGKEDVATGKIESNKSDCSGDDIERFYDELQEKILSED